jgi:hypothetical protein
MPVRGPYVPGVLGECPPRGGRSRADCGGRAGCGRTPVRRPSHRVRPDGTPRFFVWPWQRLVRGRSEYITYLVISCANGRGTGAFSRFLFANLKIRKDILAGRTGPSISSGRESGLVKRGVCRENRIDLSRSEWGCGDGGCAGVSLAATGRKLARQRELCWRSGYGGRNCFADDESCELPARRWVHEDRFSGDGVNAGGLGRGQGGRQEQSH